MSVIVPFLGTEPEAEEALASLRLLRLAPGDELIVADNTPTGRLVAGLDAARGVRAVDASAIRSSDYARNSGAAVAVNDWLLFMDADCRPAPDLIDAYFREPIGDRTGAISGNVLSDPEQPGLLPAYARSRRHHDAGNLLEHPTYGRSAGTPNLLVRRAAFEQVGGILVVYGGGDVEFSWRLQSAGWGLEFRPDAKVEHLHRTRLGPFLGQAARWGAGNAWLNKLRPGSGPRPRLVRPLGRCAAGIVVWILRGRPRQALFKGIDALWICAEAFGYLRSNAASPRRA